MKITNLVTSIAVVAVSLPVASAQQHHIYGTKEADSAMSIQRTSDQGYVIGGITKGDGVSAQATLIKTDPAGNITWSQVYGGERIEKFESVREVGVNLQNLRIGYAATGLTTSFGAGNQDAYLVGVDPAGNLAFSQSFGGSGNDRAHCIQLVRNADGKPKGYVIVGESNSFSGGNYDCYVVLTDLFGNLVASTVFGGRRTEYGYWIEQTRDGGFIVAGSTTSFQACSTSPTAQVSRDIYIVKLKPNLFIDWTRVYGSPRNEHATCVRETKQGEFIVTGSTQGFGANSQETFLLKLNPLGGLIWMNTYGGAAVDSAHAVYIDQNTAGQEQYVVSGSTNSFFVGQPYNALSYKTDMNGGLLWSHFYGGDLTDRGFELDNGVFGYAMIGYTNSFTVGGTDIYLMDMSLSGESECFQKRVELLIKQVGPCESRGGTQLFLQNQKENPDKSKPLDFVHRKCPF